MDISFLWILPPIRSSAIVSNEVMKKIAQDVEFGFWEKYDETHSVIRFATSWATTMEDTQKLIQILEKINKRKNQ